MSRISIFVIILAPVIAALAQTAGSYTPAVPAPSSFSAYGGYYDGGGGTVEGDAMRGMASVISAQGDYNLSTSAAAINLTQAQRNYIENRQQATHAYFEMQDTNRAAAAARRSPRLTHEQLVRIAADAAPRPLTVSDVDPVSGRVTWPKVLQDELFAQERGAVDQLVAKQAQYGTLGISDTSRAGEAIQKMAAKLRDQIRNLPTNDYIASKNFLKSLMYSMTKKSLG
jgi:hypothetical protein